MDTRRRSHGMYTCPIDLELCMSYMNSMDEESEIDRLRAENERLKAARPRLARKVTTYFLRDGSMKFYMGERVKYALRPGPKVTAIRASLEELYAEAEREVD